jgi:hypothetical protein
MKSWIDDTEIEEQVWSAHCCHCNLCAQQQACRLSSADDKEGHKYNYLTPGQLSAFEQCLLVLPFAKRLRLRCYEA